MRSRLRLRSKLSPLVLTWRPPAQGTVPLTNARVRRIGRHVKCKCGCQASVTECNMINCHFSDPAREKLLGLVEAGKPATRTSSTSIQAEYGKEVLLRPPSDGLLHDGLDHAVCRCRCRTRPHLSGSAEISSSAAARRRWRRASLISPELAEYRDQHRKGDIGPRMIFRSVRSRRTHYRGRLAYVLFVRSI